MKKLNKNKTLYILLLTQAVSLVGTRMTGIALGIWIFQNTGKATDLLLIPFFAELPQLLFGHILGTIVDRTNRKWTMVLSDFGQALGTFILLLAISLNVFDLWQLYVVVFIQGIFGALQAPAADATITLLTTRQNRSKVNGFKELTFPAAGVLAPVLAGLLYVVMGIGGVILVDLTTFVIGSLVVMGLDIPEPVKSQVSDDYSGQFWKESMSGFKFLWHRKGLMTLVAGYALINFLINGPLELVIPYILSLTQSEVTLSVMMAIMSIATSIGAFLLTVFELPQMKIKVLLGGALITAIGLMAFGASRSFLGLGITLFALMLPLPVLNAVFKTILQDKTPQDMQGRVFSVAYQLAFGFAPASFLLVGPMVDYWIEPMMRVRTSGMLFSLFGNQAGSGMGLVLAATGCGIIVVLIGLLWNRSFMAVEHEEPNYID